jgi:ABC-type antimicrobial peptide transport system permease subunit
MGRSWAALAALIAIASVILLTCATLVWWRLTARPITAREKWRSVSTLSAMFGLLLLALPGAVGMDWAIGMALGGVGIVLLLGALYPSWRAHRVDRGVPQ